MMGPEDRKVRSLLVNLAAVGISAVIAWVIISVILSNYLNP